MLCQLGLGAAHFADVPRLEALVALLEPYEAFNTPDTLLMSEGAVGHFLGVFRAALGDMRMATEHLERAAARNEEMGMRVYAARSRVRLAETLAAAS